MLIEGGEGALSDIFEKTREEFLLPDGIIYLDGNSLGAMPKKALARLQEAASEEWGKMLIRGWNDANWIDLPDRTGNKIARLIGAEQGTVMVGDTTSINLFKALTAALGLADRKVILSDSGNFPNDLYVAQGVVKLFGADAELRIVAPEEVDAAISDEVGVLMITDVDYRTGRRHNMQALDQKAKALGIVTIWDLCHSAGALPVNLSACNADFAVGCSYKYLNGGPGAPAFIYVRPGLADRIGPALSGWMGHEAPFAFDLDYRPASGVSRMRVGTPPVLALSALDAALDVWNGVDLNLLRARSIELCEIFIEEVERRCPDLQLASPRDAEQRGSQVSFHFAEGYAAMQALIADGVIGDFRAPDIMRFGFAPLYVSKEDAREAARRLASVILQKRYADPIFATRSKVT